MIISHCRMVFATRSTLSSRTMRIKSSRVESFYRLEHRVEDVQGLGVGRVEGSFLGVALSRGEQEPNLYQFELPTPTDKPNNPKPFALNPQTPLAQQTKKTHINK